MNRIVNSTILKLSLPLAALSLPDGRMILRKFLLSLDWMVRSFLLERPSEISLPFFAMSKERSHPPAARPQECFLVIPIKLLLLYIEP